MADTATLTPPAQTWRPSEPARPSAHSVVNVGELERWASLVGGGALALAGGSLVYRGATGHCEMYHLLGVNTAEGRGPATSVRPSGVNPSSPLPAVSRGGRGRKVATSHTMTRDWVPAASRVPSALKAIV